MELFQVLLRASCLELVKILLQKETGPWWLQKKHLFLDTNRLCDSFPCHISNKTIIIKIFLTCCYQFISTNQLQSHLQWKPMLPSTFLFTLGGKLAGPASSMKSSFQLLMAGKTKCMPMSLKILIQKNENTSM